MVYSIQAARTADIPQITVKGFEASTNIKH